LEKVKVRVGSVYVSRRPELAITICVYVFGLETNFKCDFLSVEYASGCMHSFVTEFHDTLSSWSSEEFEAQVKFDVLCSVISDVPP